MLGELLAEPHGPLLDADALLSRAASLLLMGAARIKAVESNMQKIRMPARRAVALASALTEVVHFVDTCVPPGGAVGLQLVLASEGRRLIVGLAVKGDHDLVGSTCGTQSLMNARAIVHEMNGQFGRGLAEDGMVFGIILHLPRLLVGLRAT